MISKKKDKVENQEQFETDHEPDAIDEDWETEDFGSPIKWQPQEKGESLTGVFRGFQRINGREGDFDVAIIDNNGELWSVSGYKLMNFLATIPENTTIRLTYIKDVKTSRNLNPMKDYRIDIAKKDREKVTAFRSEQSGQSETLPF